MTKNGRCATVQSFWPIQTSPSPQSLGKLHERAVLIRPAWPHYVQKGGPAFPGGDDDAATPLRDANAGPGVNAELDGCVAALIPLLGMIALVDAEPLAHP